MPAGTRVISHAAGAVTPRDPLSPRHRLTAMIPTTRTPETRSHRLDPGLGVEEDFALGVAFGDEDAVEADVQDANAVRQALHFDGDAALEAVAALDFHEHSRFLTGAQRNRLLCHRCDDIAWLDGLRQRAIAFVLHFLAVDHRRGDEL